MHFYRVNNDYGKRKRFAYGDLVEDDQSIKKYCPVCGQEWHMPGFEWWFNNKSWDIKIYLDREHYADFSGVSLHTIVSEKAKCVLMEKFNNAVDFGDINMVSLRDLSDTFLKELRVRYGSRDVKRIANNPPQYYRLLIKQGAGTDLQKSNTVLDVDCPACGLKRYKPLDDSIDYKTPPYIVKSSWKGYDIFHAEGSGITVFCTERFIDIYNENKLTGLEFEQVPVV